MRKIATQLFVLTMLLAQFAFAQERRIKGTVTSGGEPASYISVLVKGTTLGVATDEQGNFELTVPQSAKTLVFSGLGFKTKEVDISSGAVFNVELESDAMQLNEVVVTALGITREKRALGYATQQVTGEEITGSGEHNVVEALSGKVSGVEVIGSGGTPGASSKILIRGYADFTGDNQPLFIVDGIPIDNSTNDTRAGDYPFNKNLEGVNNSNRGIDINPDDIETINVLKGPSAAALYGIRAAHGAVIITTKKGRATGNQVVNVTFGTNAEFSMVNKLPERQFTYAQGVGGGKLDANGNPTTGTYVTADPGTDGIWGTGDDNPGTSSTWGPKISSVPGITSHDNAKEFFQTGTAFNNDLAIAGGNERTTFRLGVGNLNQTGVIPNTNFHRTSVRLTSETKITDKLSVFGTMNYINSGGIMAQNGSNLSGIMLGLMRTPPSFDAKGTESQPGTLPGGIQRQYFTPYDNTYWSAYNNPFTTDLNRVIGNVSFNYKPVDWVDITYRLGDDNYSDRRQQIYAIGANQITPPTGEIDNDVQSHNEVYSDLLLTLRHQFSPDFSGSLTLGNNIDDRFDEDVFARGQQLTVPNFYNMINASNFYSSGGYTKYREAAFYGDLELDYKSMVYLGLTGRQEWASSFAENHNTFFYPSANLSFVFTELIPKNNILSFGKVRYSFAQVGITPGSYTDRTYLISPILSDGLTNGLSFPYLGMNSFGYSELASLGNPNLVPERVTNNEVGADLRFFNGRLNFDITYYYQKTSDIIYTRPLAPSSGFRSLIDNGATMENKGLELIASGSPIKNKTFSWDISVNFSKYNTKVLSLPENIQQINIEDGFSGVYTYAVLNQPYGLIYGTKWERTPDGKLLIGSNGLPVASATDTVVGNPFPDWLLSFRNTLTWKGLSLTFMFDIRQGGQIWDGTQARLNRLGITAATADRDRSFVVDGEVQNSDGSYSANAKKISAQSYYGVYLGDGAGSATENAIYDGSWVRLRDLTISYHIDASKFNHFVKGIDIYATGRNLWLSTKYPGVDPETSLTGAGSNINGFDYFNNPGTKSFLFGLRAQF
jgi:TonB-linked SusC/RagA family outer membrane protein